MWLLTLFICCPSLHSILDSTVVDPIIGIFLFLHQSSTISFQSVFDSTANFSVLIGFKVFHRCTWDPPPHHSKLSLNMYLLAFNDNLKSKIGNRLLQMVKSGYQMSGTPDCWSRLEEVYPSGGAIMLLNFLCC